MIYPDKKTITTTRKEEKQISRYAGLFCGRIVLLLCLFFLFFFLNPTSIYLFTAFAFFPAILAWLFSHNETTEKNIILASCAKKYFFSYHHYTGEKYTGLFILPALALWQFILLNQDHGRPIVQKAPAICMFFYLITRLIVTKIVKKQISRYYGEFECLD